MEQAALVAILCLIKVQIVSTALTSSFLMDKAV